MKKEQKSQCVSKKHNEYDCMSAWGIRRKKFLPKKWCDPCLEMYEKSKEDTMERAWGWWRK